jgi:uncharacterized protein YndB with AHSA1/START domain
MATTRIDARPGLPFIDMTREFAAPRDLVYRAHTDPDLLAQWIGPRRLTTAVDRFDVRDGGTWRFVQRDQDGTEYAFHGVFHGDPSPERIVQTFEFEGAPGHVSLDAVSMEEHDGRTTLRVHSVFQTLEARDAMVASGMESGVEEGYERMDELIERVLAPAR